MTHSHGAGASRKVIHFLLSIGPSCRMKISKMFSFKAISKYGDIAIKKTLYTYRINS